MITGSDDDYYVYLPESGFLDLWGCTVLSAGFTQIPPGSVYPPVRHPDDHHFVWERGRTLQAYQFALITSGRGQFQSAPRSDVVHEIVPGDVLLLFPGIWHRFAPDKPIGWTEGWIECRGTAFDHAMQLGVLGPDRPVWHGAGPAAEVFAQIHALAREDALVHQAILSTLGLQLLAQLCELNGGQERERTRIAEKARRILAEETGIPMRFESLASRIGVSYPTLRRVFRDYTGVSLKQYQTDVRVRRACELLRNSNRSVKEIAGLLGYSSAFHFSQQFSKATGLAPTHWRSRNRM